MGEWDQIDRARLVLSFERLFAVLRRLNLPQDISLTAASTLRTLELCGPQRLSDLAVREGVTQPAMTQLVARLEREHLVERQTDPSDGRVVLVAIASAGRELLRHRRAARGEKLAGLLAALSPEDRSAIMAALPALDRLSDLGSPS